VVRSPALLCAGCEEQGAAASFVVYTVTITIAVGMAMIITTTAIVAIIAIIDTPQLGQQQTAFFFVCESEMQP
jgi:hypothetical protein